MRRAARRRGVAAVTQHERGRTLAGQPLLNRAAIVAAGPVANFILALAIFTGLFMAFGRSEHVARIGFVEPGSPAAQAGFEAGDLVTAINGQPITVPGAAAGGDSQHRPDDDLRRRPRRRDVTLTRRPQSCWSIRARSASAGSDISASAPSRDPADVTSRRCAPTTCVVWAREQVGFIVAATVAYVAGLFAGRESVDQVSGPIGDLADRRRNGEGQPVGVAQPGGAVFGLGRADESAAGAAARRRPSVFFAFEALRGRP